MKSFNLGFYGYESENRIFIDLIESSFNQLGYKTNTQINLYKNTESLNAIFSYGAHLGHANKNKNDYTFVMEASFNRSPSLRRAYFKNELNFQFLDQFFWKEKFEYFSKEFPNYDKWIQTDDAITIYLNRQYGGFGNQGVDQYQWAKETVLELSKYTDRPIFVQHHPEGFCEGGANEEGLSNFWNIFNNLNKELKNKITPVWINEQSSWSGRPKRPWAVIAFNSSAPVVPFLHGAPMFILGNSNLRKFSCGGLENIETPNYNVDKTAFLKYLSQLHWSESQFKNAQFVQTILNFIKNNPKK
jgi:hypothetical protein